MGGLICVTDCAGRKRVMTCMDIGSSRNIADVTWRMLIRKNMREAPRHMGFSTRIYAIYV